MYISKTLDTQYNNNIGSHKKTELILIWYIYNYRTLVFDHKHLIVWSPPSLKTANVKAVLLSRKE